MSDSYLERTSIEIIMAKTVLKASKVTNFKKDYFWIFGKTIKDIEYFESDPMRKGFLDNYGFLMSMAGIYLTFPGNWIISMLHLGVGSLQLICYFYTIYLTNDMGNVIELLHSAVIVMTITGPAIINGLLQRKRLERIMRRVPVHCWYPLDSRVPLNNLLCFIFQYVIVVTIPLGVCGLDLIYLCMAEEIVIQLKIVGTSVKNIKKRAMKVMKLNGTNDINKAMSRCLGHSIDHHNALSSLFEDFRNYHFYILLSVMTGATLMLCLAGVIFTTDSVAPVFRLTYVVFINTELVHVLVFCWYGEQIKEMSIKIGDDMYDADWFSESGHIKIHMLMIIQKIVRPFKVTAGGFMDASMDTYANVLSSAYSYFNLVKAAREN
ncbi:odorant receptor 4-like isoform X3 [Rhodnius prolixus]|uniref:odorant receptor 4-like isoform X3 n=1 Tax=Rhodnius prolixus TaxID=13249 RepID=UPI003D187A67